MSEKDTTPYSIQLDAVHTHELGLALGKNIAAGQIIALQGDLGAGKTTFAQGLAEGMGIDAIVTSPTFTLVNEYGTDRSIRLIHLDTYRLDELPEEAMLESATFGLEEILDQANLVDSSGGGAVVVVEWAERIAPLLPEDHLHVEIKPGRNSQLRNVDCTAFGKKSAELLRLAADQLAT